MQKPKEIIYIALKNWLEKKSISIDFEVSLSQNLHFGDFSTNIALVASKELKNSPHQAAEELRLEIEQWKLESIDRVEVAGPGFINFYLSQKYLSQMLQMVVQSRDDFGEMDNKKPQKIIVEFGDPNPFKEIHIGHLRNFCIGESFSRLLESQGNTVVRANYQGDVGLHVAKCIWGLQQNLKLKTENTKLTVGDLAQGYVLGSKMFEENDEAKHEIIELNKKIYSEDGSVMHLWEQGRKVSLEYFEQQYKRIGFAYDKYYFESVTAKKGKEIVLSHIDDGVFERNDGAVIYKGERDGLHTRVFLTSAEYATYEGKDLALAILKNEDVSYDESVILTGNEQLEYFQVMLAVLKRINPELAEKTKHFTFGHVRLKEGKMSSRTGDVITSSWLLDEAVNRVQKAFPDLDPDTSDKVGVGSVKYSMLKFAIPSDIHFSFEESISLEGNSGPYLQYAYVRTQSVLRKANDAKCGEEMSELDVINLKLEIEEIELLRFLSQYPYHIELAASTLSPNLLCNYLFELSKRYNLFYQKCKVIGSQNEAFRLALTRAVGIIIKNGLNLLAIETIDKM